MSVLAVVGLSMISGSASAAAESRSREQTFEAEFIFEKAPFPQCHASTIAESKGRLVAAWFGGTKEGHEDVGIWLSRREKAGWTEPVEVANGIQTAGSRHPCWNPVLFQPGSGPLLLFYKVGPSPRAWWGMLMRSADGGRTWSEPWRLPEGILGPIKNKPVQLRNGDILCPSSTEQSGWRIHFETMRADGYRWLTTGPLDSSASFGCIQPAVLVHSAQELQALGRSRKGTIFQVWSHDAGQNWDEVRATELPNPNSGIDAVTLRNGHHVLVYNHTPRGRSPLNVAVSKDGLQWRTVAALETEPGEYSYPAVIQTRDGHVHFTYTWKRERIKHVSMKTKELLRSLKPF